MRSLERWAISAEALNLRWATCASTDPRLVRSAMAWAELEAYGGAGWVVLGNVCAWLRCA